MSPWKRLGEAAIVLMLVHMIPVHPGFIGTPVPRGRFHSSCTLSAFSGGFDSIERIKEIAQYSHEQRSQELARCSTGFRRLELKKRAFRCENIPREEAKKYMMSKLMELGISKEDCDLMSWAKMMQDIDGSFSFSTNEGGVASAMIFIYKEGSKPECLDLLYLKGDAKFELAPELVTRELTDSGSFLFFSWSCSKTRTSIEEATMTSQKKSVVEQYLLADLVGQLHTEDLKLLRE